MAARTAAAMKRAMSRPSPLSFLAAALLAGCGAQDEPAYNEAPVQVPALPVDNGATTELSEAQLRARAEEALGQILRDPSAARYADLRNGSGGAVCGMVELPQGPANLRGPRPFVVSPAGVAVLSASPRVNLNDPADPFADSYMRWCATPEELGALQQGMGNFTTPNMFTPVREIPEFNELPPETPPEEVGRWRDQPVMQGNGSADEGSFQNAVRRRGR